MKNTFCPTILSAILVLLFFSCSNDGGPVGPGTGPTSWQLENFRYDGGASANNSSIITLNETDIELGVLVVTTAEDSGKGAFSGSVVSIIYPIFGGGLYSLTTREEQIQILNENPNAQVAVLECVVGTATTEGTTSYLLQGNSIEVSVDSEGKYHFDISSSIQLQKGLDVNGGVDNAPQFADFTLNNAFDFSN